MQILSVIMLSWAMSLLNSLRWCLWKNLGNKFYNHIQATPVKLPFTFFDTYGLMMAALWNRNMQMIWIFYSKIVCRGITPLLRPNISCQLQIFATCQITVANYDTNSKHQLDIITQISDNDQASNRSSVLDSPYTPHTTDCKSYSKYNNTTSSQLLKALYVHCASNIIYPLQIRSICTNSYSRLLHFGAKYPKF